MNLRKINRRQALAFGATTAAGVFAFKAKGARGIQVSAQTSTNASSFWEPVEDVIQAQGMFSDGVFSIEIDRNDIDDVTLHGVPVKPAFQINGTLYFQKLDDDTVMMNSDLALKAEELDPVIDQLLAHDIVFQAEHQHFYDFDPLVWFIHFRKKGDPLEIARGVKAALDVTATPFPQTMPSNPTTPLPADEIGKILGASPSVGSDGVVNYDVPREDPLWLGGVRINPYLNTATSIAFEPLEGGKKAAAAPDFGMVASEINPLVKIMRQQGWDIGCLYNQETDEHPQLFFSHQFKTGGPIQLAHEIRNGLNLMDVKFR
jgi:hypothetical protein